MITAKQCQAGRRLLRMTENDLSIASGVSVEAIVGFESGKRSLNDFSQQALRQAFEASGAVLLEDDARLPAVICMALPKTQGTKASAASWNRSGASSYAPAATARTCPLRGGRSGMARQQPTYAARRSPEHVATETPFHVPLERVASGFELSGSVR
jgi:hypothetical protein